MYSFSYAVSQTRFLKAEQNCGQARGVLKFLKQSLAAGGPAEMLVSLPSVRGSKEFQEPQSWVTKMNGMGGGFANK